MPAHAQQNLIRLEERSVSMRGGAAPDSHRHPGRVSHLKETGDTSDTCHLRSATEDQMEMMMLMDKLPEFYDSYNDVADHLSPTEFLAASAGNISISHFNTDNPHNASSPPFTNLQQSTLSSNSNGTPTQDQSPQDFFPSPSSSRWRGLDEAIHYVKFLKTQVQSLERAQANRPTTTTGIGFPMGKGYHQPPARRRQNVQNYGDA
ncbi:hypothetical protein D5086_004676 [Populus alba]|uniref:Uncharacterized protein n=1 Tax=Populus alba TaxID=43335 RepID=A0ACC4CRJ0_POPAL